MIFHCGSKVFSLTVPCMVVLSLTGSAIADLFIFQQGVDGYERAQDTSIRWAYTVNFGDTADVDNPHWGDMSAYEMQSTNGGVTDILEAGQFFQKLTGAVKMGQSSIEAGPVIRYARFFIRFRDVFGTAAGQVPPEVPVTSAKLHLYNDNDLGPERAKSTPDGEFTPEIETTPKLNAGTIGLYPMLVSTRWGTNDGLANKGVVTAGQKRRGKENWSQDCSAAHAPNDPIAAAFNCGPSDVGDPHATPGTEEYDSSHPGAIEVAQDATEGFKVFDVTGLLDSLTGNGVFVTGLSPGDELHTLDINYGQAYRSGEFGSTAEDFTTRPMLVIDTGGASTPGDANGDGVVDVGDLGIVGANFGSTNATPADGDFTGDGNVDVADLGVVGANWTTAQAGAAAASLIPEPATTTVLTLGLMWFGRRRRTCS